MPRLGLAAVLILGLAAPGWAANKDVERLYIQVAALQSQIADLQRSSEETLREVRRLNELLADQAAQARHSQQERRVQEEAFQSAIRDLTERLGLLGEQLQALRMASSGPSVDPFSGATPPGTAGTPGGTAPPAPAGLPPPRELYTQAYADYARGNFDLAIQQWQEYLKYYASTEFADNAQYWIGECLYSKQQFADAIQAWDQLLRAFPSSDKLPDARLKKGMALERLGRRREALDEFRVVADRYPNSEAGRKARERINP